jgi:hypothetical protein
LYDSLSQLFAEENLQHLSGCACLNNFFEAAFDVTPAPLAREQPEATDSAILGIADPATVQLDASDS